MLEIYRETRGYDKGADAGTKQKIADYQVGFRRRCHRVYLRICGRGRRHDDAVCADVVSGLRNARCRGNKRVYHVVYGAYRRNQSFYYRRHAGCVVSGSVRRVYADMFADCRENSKQSRREGVEQSCRRGADSNKRCDSCGELFILIPNYLGKDKHVSIEYRGFNENNIQYTNVKKFKMDIYKKKGIILISVVKKRRMILKQALIEN